MRLVERLSRLNASHIVATSRLSGTEIELLGIQDRLDRQAVPSAPAATADDAERARVERVRRELLDERAAIDRQRDVLDRDLQAIDEALASLSRTADFTDRRGREPGENR